MLAGKIYFIWEKILGYSLLPYLRGIHEVRVNWTDFPIRVKLFVSIRLLRRRLQPSNFQMESWLFRKIKVASLVSPWLTLGRHNLKNYGGGGLRYLSWLICVFSGKTNLNNKKSKIVSFLIQLKLIPWFMSSLCKDFLLECSIFFNILIYEFIDSLKFFYNLKKLLFSFNSR